MPIQGQRRTFHERARRGLGAVSSLPRASQPRAVEQDPWCVKRVVQRRCARRLNAFVPPPAPAARAGASQRRNALRVAAHGASRASGMTRSPSCVRCEPFSGRVRLHASYERMLSPALAAGDSLRICAPSINRSRSLAWSSAHRVSLHERARSPRVRIHPPAWTAPAPLVLPGERV
jgi:hypothetical protein